MTSLCKLFKLNRAQELFFVFALQNSTHNALKLLTKEHMQQCLPEFIRITSSGMLKNTHTLSLFCSISCFQLSFIDNGMIETGLNDLPVEVLHSLLLLIRQYISNESTDLFINNEELEKFLDVIRKGIQIGLANFIHILSQYFRILQRTNRK